MIRSLIPLQLAALTVAALATVNTHAAIFFTVDSPVELTGTFSTSNSSGSSEYGYPGVFAALPGGGPLELVRQAGAASATDFFFYCITGYTG